MKVTSHILPKTQAELTIELSVEELQPYVDKAAKRISQEVEIQGFRKGKAPYDVVAQRVGENTIYEEAFSEVVEKTYPDAVDQEKLQVVGRAQIDIEKMAPGNPLIYKAIVPLMPKVTLGNYKKLKAKKAETVLDEEKYEKTIKDLLKMKAAEKVVDRAAKKGDKVILDFDVAVGGVPIEGGKGENQGLMIGDGQFIPGFEEEIIGMKKGDEKDFTLQFPDTYKKDLAGKKGEFHVKVHDVFEVTLPEFDDAFAQGLNFETKEELENSVKSNVIKELAGKAENDFERTVIEEIMDMSQFEDIPDQLIDEEVDKMVEEMKHDIMQQGMKFDDYLQHLDKKEEDIRADFRKSGEKRIKSALTMREVAIAENVQVQVAEIEKEIEEMKKMYEHVPEAAVQIESDANRAQIENRLMHQNTFAKLESYTAGGGTQSATDTAEEKAGKQAGKKEKKNDK